MKYDIERLESDLLQIVQDNLSAKLAEIEAEKADSISLVAPSNSEYFSTTSDAVDNRIYSIQYGVESVDTLSNSSSTAEVVRLIFLRYIPELNQQQGVVRKQLYRYARAFKEIIEENFRKIPCSSTIKITTVAPQRWQDNEFAAVYKVAGIYIETEIVS